MRIWTAGRTRLLVPTGSVSGRRLALERSSRLPTAHRSRHEVSKLDRARDHVDQTSPRWEGRGQHLIQSRMHRDLRIVAALALPFSATRPGRKHHRSIGLEDWQDRIVGSYPRQLLRGLIHSDGCRTINRVRDGRYAYPRYFFTNRSTDILEIFRQACDAAQIAHSSSKLDTISIARREAVAALDAFIGPKS
jgi:hypothetical protein